MARLKLDGRVIATPVDPAHPPTDPREAEELMRGVGVAMFVLGSVTLLATLPLPDPNASDHPAIELIAALLGLGAVFTWILRPGRGWVSRERRAAQRGGAGPLGPSPRRRPVKTKSPPQWTLCRGGKGRR